MWKIYLNLNIEHDKKLEEATILDKGAITLEN